MCGLLERARKEQGNISYYRIAKLLNVSDQQMTKWKNDISKPNGLNTLKLAKLAKVDVKEAIKLVEAGFTTIGAMVSMAIANCLCFSVITQSSYKPLLASIKESVLCILC